MGDADAELMAFLSEVDAIEKQTGTSAGAAGPAPVETEPPSRPPPMPGDVGARRALLWFLTCAEASSPPRLPRAGPLLRGWLCESPVARQCALRTCLAGHQPASGGRRRNCNAEELPPHPPRRKAHHLFCSPQQSLLRLHWRHQRHRSGPLLRVAPLGVLVCRSCALPRPSRRRSLPLRWPGFKARGRSSASRCRWRRLSSRSRPRLNRPK